MVKWMRRIFWGAVGAGVGYFFDPVSGRGRRTRLRDQWAASMRDVTGTVERRARYQVGRARGMVHEMAGGDEPPADDQTLLQKVRSEAVGYVQGEVSHIDLRVDDGVVYLVGESRDASAEEELVARIRGVTGVRDIRNELVDA